MAACFTPGLLARTEGPRSDFKPTEIAFAKLKANLRAQAARTVAELCNTLTQALGRFTPNECGNYLMAAGYDALDPT